MQIVSGVFDARPFNVPNVHVHVHDWCPLTASESAPYCCARRRWISSWKVPAVRKRKNVCELLTNHAFYSSRLRHINTFPLIPNASTFYNDKNIIDVKLAQISLDVPLMINGVVIITLL